MTQEEWNKRCEALGEEIAELIGKHCPHINSEDPMTVETAEAHGNEYAMATAALASNLGGIIASAVILSGDQAYQPKLAEAGALTSRAMHQTFAAVQAMREAATATKQ